MSQQFKIRFVDNVEGLLEVWPFLLEGYQELRKLHETRRGVSEGSFFKLLLSILSMPEGAGCIAVVESLKGNHAGYMIAMDNSDEFRETGRTLLIYYVYHKGAFGTNTRIALLEIEKWAKKHGYSEIHACSSRITGAAMRLFEKRWGFKRDLISFRKTI